MNYVYIFYAIVNFGRERETRGEGACLAKPKGKGQNALTVSFGQSINWLNNLKFKSSSN